MPRQLRTPPTVIPRAEIERDTAQRQAFAPPRNQIREAASMAGEIVGTEPLARGVMALRGDYTGRPEPGRAAGEFGMAAVNLGLGALGLADDVATVRAARPLPPGQWEPVFRGMREPFDGTLRPQPQGWYGNTLSVSRSPEAANVYARSGGTFGEGANVMPMQARGPFATHQQFSELVSRNMGGGRWSAAREQRAVERATQELRRRGYTGVQSEIDAEIALFPDDGGAFPQVRFHFDAPPSAPETAPRPTPPPRQIGRASDGSVLPVREPQPIRQSLVGGSDDLREAARLNNRPDPHGEGVGADMREPRFFERRGSVNVTTRAQPMPPPASSETGFGALGRGSNNTIAYGMGGIAGLGALAIPATSTAMQALNPIEQAMLEAEAKQRELEAELYAIRNGLPSPAYSGALVPPRRRAQQNAPSR